jgi:MSHA pilin protein MshA
MNKTASGRQSGFTLIELIVVIVVLGILAATALPRFVNMSADARVAKMRAAEGALKTGASLFHAAWLAANSPTASTAPDNSSITNSVVSMEGQRIAFIYGYPDAGGDGAANASVVPANIGNSGILVAAGLASPGVANNDYQFDVVAAPNDAIRIRVYPDASHKAAGNCYVEYTEATSTTTAPVIDSTNLQTTSNCQ